jgi:hypothetical protein
MNKIRKISISSNIFFIEKIHINQSSHVELSKPKEKNVHMCGNVLVANIGIIRQKVSTLFKQRNEEENKGQIIESILVEN